MNHSTSARITSDFLGSAVVPTAAVGVSPTAFPVPDARTLWMNPQACPSWFGLQPLSWFIIDSCQTSA